MMRLFERPRTLTLVVGLALAATPAAAVEPPKPASEGDKTIGGAIAQPVRDLNIMREQIPPALVAAAAKPYAPPVDCPSAEAEIARLDAVLGQDVDAPAKAGEGFDGEALLSGAVRSAIGLPFRGVVRRLSGAEKRDQAFRAAVLAGMVRRGYLRGVRGQMTCEPPATLAVAAPAPAAPPQQEQAVAAAAPDPSAQPVVAEAAPPAPADPAAVASTVVASQTEPEPQAVAAEAVALPASEIASDVAP